MESDMKKFFEAADAFQLADDAWQEALVAKYGKDASTMRYLAHGQGLECDVIKEAYRKRYAAMQAFMAMQQP